MKKTAKCSFEESQNIEITKAYSREIATSQIYKVATIGIKIQNPFGLKLVRNNGLCTMPFCGDATPQNPQGKIHVTPLTLTLHVHLCLHYLIALIDMLWAPMLEFIVSGFIWHSDFIWLQTLFCQCGANSQISFAEHPRF